MEASPGADFHDPEARLAHPGEHQQTTQGQKPPKEDGIRITILGRIGHVDHVNAECRTFRRPLLRRHGRARLARPISLA